MDQLIKVSKKLKKFVYNKDYFGTNLRLTEIQSYSGLNQLLKLNQIQKKRENFSKNYFKLISKYQKNFLHFLSL